MTNLYLLHVSPFFERPTNFPVEFESSCCQRMCYEPVKGKAKCQEQQFVYEIRVVIWVKIGLQIENRW